MNRLRERNPCEVCGGEVDMTPGECQAAGVSPCVCPDCPVCGQTGDPECYTPIVDGGHGMKPTENQIATKSAIDRAREEATDNDFALET